MKLAFADLFCGAGGTSTGLVQAANDCGISIDVTAVDHWPTAVATHQRNHPGHRHLCADIDAVAPHALFDGRPISGLWASPACTHHSNARGGKPRHEQQRATAHCVPRWIEATRPDIVWVENVREFLQWGPLDAAGKPIIGRKGESFAAWVQMIRSLGYQVEHRMLCAADYGVPTSRTRLIVQARPDGKPMIWPEPTHAGRWVSVQSIIDWSDAGQSLSRRSRKLAATTMARVRCGIRRFGGRPFVVAWDHTGTPNGGVWSVEEPLSTVTTKQRHGIVRPFLISYYGNGQAISTEEPLPTVTTKARFGLVTPVVATDGRRRRVDWYFRMLSVRENARAQGFPDSYQFVGSAEDSMRQIGNAVPCGLARALAAAYFRSRK